MSPPGTEEVVEEIVVPDTVEELLGGEDVRPDRPWVVIVWNDPVNTFAYVIFVFQKLFGYSRAKARRPRAALLPAPARPLRARLRLRTVRASSTPTGCVSTWRGSRPTSSKGAGQEAPATCGRAPTSRSSSRSSAPSLGLARAGSSPSSWSASRRRCCRS